jgi:hypothetical protein
MGSKKTVLFLSLFIIVTNCFSQETDFQSWVNVELKGEIFKKVDFSISPEVRIQDNSTRVKTMICEIELSVPLYKYFRIGGIYRPELDVSGEYASRGNRFCLYGQVDYKIKRFRINYRAIYQQEYKDFNRSENGHIPLIQHRQKIGIKYNIKNSKITPSASAEMFFTLRPYEKEGQKKLRISVGADYSINKKLSCYIGYKFQREYMVNNPETAHVFNLSLSYAL